jgi:Fur family ferric uptake transcriptional regulator
MTSTDQLKTLGLKVTGPRLKILSLFEQTDQRHLTADDVYRQLMTDSIDVGLATVYRVLTQFEHAGILIRHHFDNDKAVYELNRGGHHDHLLCLQCGHVEEFFDEGNRTSPTCHRQETRIQAGGTRAASLCGMRAQELPESDQELA